MSLDFSSSAKDQPKKQAARTREPAPDEADLLYLQRMAGNRAVGQLLRSRGLPIIQRKPIDNAPPSEPTPEETAAPGLIVDDEATTVEPDQMRKSEFLAELQTEVCKAAETAMTGTGRTTDGCPYLGYWFNFYSQKDSQHIERALHKYAPETARARAAGEYIPLVVERVRQGVEHWARTGEITEVPEELRGEAAGSSSTPGNYSEAISSAGSSDGGSSTSGGVLFKARDGGARETGDPRAIQAQLGSGHSLDGSVKSRMKTAFGYDFANVRLHTDSKSAQLSKTLNARAFTIGQDVAFGAGEYQPGTLIGDAIIAHELAHVVQQGGPSTKASTMQNGAAEYNLLEEDADTSAASVVVSLWGEASGELAQIARNAKPRLRSGLSLQRCTDKKTNDVLKDFAAKFSDAAELIRKSPAAMTLVGEAQAAGVKFGGYAEEGPGKDLGRAYTVGSTVYVPKARTDKVLAMKSFLFELNNAIRAPKFAEIDKEAVKGTKGTLTAQQYAYKSIELEVEGMLRLGEVWFETKKTIGKEAEWNKYDHQFYLSEYTAFKEGKKTKDDIVKDVLQRVYDTGTLKGKTAEQYYMEEYNKLSGGK